MKNLCNRHSMGLCAAIKISEVISSEKWMELEIIMLSEISQNQQTNVTMIRELCLNVCVRKPISPIFIQEPCFKANKWFILSQIYVVNFWVHVFKLPSVTFSGRKEVI